MSFFSSQRIIKRILNFKLFFAGGEGHKMCCAGYSSKLPNIRVFLKNLMGYFFLIELRKLGIG